MKETNEVYTSHLDLLFEAELQYRPQAARVTDGAGAVGEYLGSGDGFVKGPEIEGTVLWDLFEEQAEAFCRSTFVGKIETQDGAHIPFESLGFLVRPDASEPDQWLASAAIRFDATDEHYHWLGQTLAVWEGVFDMSIYRHRYRVYAPPQNSRAV